MGDDIDNSHSIVVWVRHLEVGDEDGLIQPPAKNYVRSDAEVGIMFRKCPHHHPCLAKSKKSYPPNEKLLLASLTCYVDFQVTSVVPQSLINFTTRTAIGGVWESILQVAEGVRDGERPLHKEAI